MSSGPMAKLVLFVLLGFSVASWGIMAERWRSFGRAQRESDAFLDRFKKGGGLAAIQEAAGEPVLAVLVPGSPMPVTGCTITVRRSECIDLNITFDQACQFIVSCGVVVPPQQLGQMRIADNRRLESPPTA